MARIEIYSKNHCSFCRMAKLVLQSKGLHFEEYNIAFDPALEQQMLARSQRRTVPQIFVDGEHIGGFTDMMQRINEGTFPPLIDG